MTERNRERGKETEIETWRIAFRFIANPGLQAKGSAVVSKTRVSSRCFLWLFLVRLFRGSGKNRCHFGGLCAFLGGFSKFEGCCWIALPLERKPTFRGFGDPVYAFFCFFSEVSFLGGVFIEISVIWVTFWTPMAPSMGLLGHPLDSLSRHFGSLGRAWASRGAQDLPKHHL